MPSNSPVYDEVNRKWKATCRILLGGEVGELDEFENYLYSKGRPRLKATSALSGKEVVISDPNYSKKARFISFDEIDFASRPPQLSINSIKDLDSILASISSISLYCGNIVLGECSGIENSDTIVDSHYAYHSEWTSHCKYLGYTSSSVHGENVFGGHWCSGSFLIRTNCFLSNRCFEVTKTDYSSDIYCSHGLSSCQECMFSFNLKSKRHRIGNLELPKEKYAELKKKLLSEIREKLAKDKGFPHIYELFAGVAPDHGKLKAAASAMPEIHLKAPNTAPVESAFSATSKLIFGVELRGLEKYASWLKYNTPVFEEATSCASGKLVLISEYDDFLCFPRDRVINNEEAEFCGERLALSRDEAESLSVSNAGRTLSHIAYFNPEWAVGNIANNHECPVSVDVIDSYGTIIGVSSKKCAFGRWPRESEALFGFHRMRLSSFCIRCFHSERIQRCFEVSEGHNCAGCYYCHNIENVHDSMFCFNAKNLRYAVGNVELPREKYAEIKKRVLAQLNEELSSTNQISLSIFNLADRVKASR